MSMNLGERLAEMRRLNITLQDMQLAATLDLSPEDLIERVLAGTWVSRPEVKRFAITPLDLILQALDKPN